jgi:integrase
LVSLDYFSLLLDSENFEKLRNSIKEFRKSKLSKLEVKKKKDILEFSDILNILLRIEKTNYDSEFCRHRDIASIILLYYTGERISKLLK